MQMKKLAKAGLLVPCALALLISIAYASAGTEGTEQSVNVGGPDADLIRNAAEILDELSDPIDMVLFYVTLGSQDPPATGTRQCAQYVINLLEGPESDLYGPTSFAAPEYSQGIRRRLAELQSPPPGWERQWEDLDNMLRLTSNAMVSILEENPPLAETRDVFAISEVLLEAANRRIDELLQEWGYEIWVLYGESIQAAIDSASPGATINIAPGTFRETLEITKSVSLVGWSDAPLHSSGGGRRGYGATLQPVGNQSGILVHSSDPIVVQIQKLNIEAALYGIEVSGQVELHIQDVDIVDTGIGIEVRDEAIVAISNGYFESNDVALLALGFSEVDVRDSRALGCKSPVAAVQARESCVMTVAETFIQENLGSGVLASGQAQLSMIDTYIPFNDGDGVLLAGGSQVEISSSVITSTK